MILGAAVDTSRKATIELNRLVFLQERKINLCCSRILQSQTVFKVDQRRERAVRVVDEKERVGERAMEGFIRWADRHLRLDTLVNT